MIKRIISLFIITVILLTNLLSCQNSPKTSDVENDMDDDSALIQSMPPPSDYKTYYFYEYEEFAKWITKDENGRAPATDDISDDFSDRYVDFINNVVEGETQILEPFVDSEIWLKEPRKLVMTTEWLKLPTVWYYYNTEDEDNSTIVVTYYLNDEEREFLKNNNIFGFIGAYASPSFPLPGEIHLDSGILSVESVELHLKNRTVTAYVRKSSSHRHKAMFVYDDVIVSVEPMQYFDDISWESFWSNFSLELSPIYSLMPQ